MKTILDKDIDLKIETNEAASTVSYCYYHKKTGNLYRPDAPAKVVYKVKKDGEMVKMEERWHTHPGVSGPSRVGKPAVIVYNIHRNDNSITYLKYMFAGEPHNARGPAIISYSVDGKEILDKEWFIHGKRHRENGPAVISKRLREVEYYKNDVLHREDGPARIIVSRLYSKRFFFFEEYMVKKEYYVKGKRQSINGTPSVLAYKTILPNLEIEFLKEFKYEHYHVNDKEENPNGGPANILYDYYGNKLICEYRKNGMLHRTDGPAKIRYANKSLLGFIKSRKIDQQEYFAKGKRCYKVENGWIVVLSKDNHVFFYDEFFEMWANS